MSVHCQVTVLSGLGRLDVDDLATGLLLHGQRLAVVAPDPTPAGAGHVVIRTQDTEGRGRSARLPLAHDCASCTLRLGTVAALVELAATGDYDDLAVQLHPGIEPDAALRGLAATLPEQLRLDGHVTVLGHDWLEVLSGGISLADQGAGLDDTDDRFAAAVLAAGIETATAIVLPRRLQSAAQRTEQRAVLDVLAPKALRLQLPTVLDLPPGLLGRGRWDPRVLDPMAEYGIRDPHCVLRPAGSLRLVRWSADRPLHPLRLHAALDHLADGVIRSSGRLDVADQPQSVVGWDSAGQSLLLGPIAARGTRSGGRSALAFLGDDLDPALIHTVLDDCLLDDQELAMLSSTWDHLGDLSDGDAA